jgi:hypothetical protein
VRNYFLIKQVNYSWMADRCSARTRVAFDSVFLPFHRIEEANILPLKRKVCVAAVASSMSQKSSMHACIRSNSNPSIHGRIYAVSSTRWQIHVDFEYIYFSPLVFSTYCMKLNTVSRSVLGMFRISANSSVPKQQVMHTHLIER